MSINIAKLGVVIEDYLKRLGKPVIVKRADNSEEQIFAVIEQTWRKNKSKFEDASSMIGQHGEDFYEYFGPASFDITQMGDNDYFVCEGIKYYFVKTEKVIVGEHVQYYTGMLKRIWEDDTDVFS